jgi:hypothetical protein
VIAADQMETVREFQGKREQKDNAFERELTSVDIIAQEKIPRIPFAGLENPE